MALRQLISVLTSALVLTSCAGWPGASDLQVASSSTESRDADADRNPRHATKAPRSVLQQMVKMARQDLADILDIDQALIETLSAEHVTWRDSALGCPEVGNEYMQVLTSGTRIRLQWDGQVFEYHSGGNRPPFLCRMPDPQGALPSPPGEA